MENAVIGILIPFAGTSLGAACVYAMKQELDRQVQRGLTGFASGVMIAASIWSLLIPAMEEAAPLGKFAFVPAVAGFWLGISWPWTGWCRIYTCTVKKPKDRTATCSGRRCSSWP